MKSELYENGFCIVLSKYRLYQGVALLRSLADTLLSPRVFILCMDDETYATLKLLDFKNVTLIKSINLENTLLLMKKAERKLNEYCWTLKPVLIEYIMTNSDLGRVTYIDADIYFFFDCTRIFNDALKYSVLLSKHDFPQKLSNIANRCGRYNSGFISFKRDKDGLRCLDWWKGKCLQWCGDKAEKGKFGDQKYLDNMPFLSKRVCEIKTPGVNIAPWNHEKYTFSLNDGEIYINSNRLIFYHYCGFRIVDKTKFALTLDLDKKLIPLIYTPYTSAVQKAINDIEKVNPDFDGCYIEPERVQIAYPLAL